MRGMRVTVGTFGDRTLISRRRLSRVARELITSSGPAFTYSLAKPPDCTARVERIPVTNLWDRSAQQLISDIDVGLSGRQK
jgi:hypothetical protein